MDWTAYASEIKRYIHTKKNCKHLTCVCVYKNVIFALIETNKYNLILLIIGSMSLEITVIAIAIATAFHHG